MFPSLQEGQVISVDPRLRRLTVQLASAQIVDVRVGYYGPADGVRVSHKALPGRGSWGIVAFPFGDKRAGIWLCTSHPNFQDALTTETDPFMEYDSHWSGAYEMLDQNGQWLKSFPDGTFFLVSGSAVKPTTYHHTVDDKQVQHLTIFPDSERVPNPPSPRYIYVNHPSGTNAEIDPKGNTTVNGAANAVCTVKFNGAFITIDANGGIEINTAGGQNMKVSAGGGATSYTLVRTDLLVSWLNSHTHPDPQGSTTGTPSSPATIAGIQSTMTNVSE